MSNLLINNSFSVWMCWSNTEVWFQSSRTTLMPLSFSWLVSRSSLYRFSATEVGSSSYQSSVCIMNEYSRLNENLNNYPIVQFIHYSSPLCTSPRLMTPLHNLPLLNYLFVCLGEWASIKPVSYQEYKQFSSESHFKFRHFLKRNVKLAITSFVSIVIISVNKNSFVS